MFKETIETARLLLRPFTLEDIDASYQMNLDPEVVRYTHDGGVLTYEEIKERITDVVLNDYPTNGFGRFAVILKVTNAFIGFSGLKYLPEYDEVDLGYRFMKKYWGQGYATESCKVSIQFGFEQLKLDKIAGYALPENIGSIKVMEKLNFKFEKQFLEDDVLMDKYVLRKKV